MKKIILLALLLFATIKVSCGVVDHDVMFQAYLDNDMKRWGREIQKYIVRKDLTIDDKIYLSNYLYGYVAAVLESEKESVIESLIKVWEGYLKEIEAARGRRADVHVYRSAIAAYKFKLNSMLLAQGVRSFRELDKAFDIDSNNFLVLQLKGNVKFYLPGSKKESIVWFECAIKNADTHVAYRWNRCAVIVNLAQAYEKIGNKAKAIEICKNALIEEPNFIYLRDVYYPSLFK